MAYIHSQEGIASSAAQSVLNQEKENAVFDGSRRSVRRNVGRSVPLPRTDGKALATWSMSKAWALSND